MKANFSHTFSTTLFVVLAAFCGMSLAAWSTHLGPGVGGDATIYLTSARNLAQGIGLGLIEPDGSFRLLPYSAPLFPLILTPFSLFGLDLTYVARWMNIQLFGFLILLVGFVTTRLAGGSKLACVPAWLLAVSPILLPVYSWAMAEPVTLALGFGGLIFVNFRLSKRAESQILWSAIPGMILGLASAARYSALAFLLSGLVMVLIWGGGTFGKRLFQAFIMGLAGAIPPGLWVLVQVSQTNGVSARSLLSAPQMLERLAAFWPQFNSAVLVWLFPASFQESTQFRSGIGYLLPVLASLILVAATIWIFGKAARGTSARLVASLWVFTIIYLLVILGVYLTTYPPITIDNRMLSPVHVSIMWLTGLILVESRIWLSSGKLQTGIFLLFISVTAYFGFRTVRIVMQNAETGLGYNASSWKSSPLIAKVKEIGDETKIITNEPMALLYLMDIVSSPIAELYIDEPKDVFTMYGNGAKGLDKAEEEFRQGKSSLVLFDSLSTQLESIYGDQTAERARVLVDGLDVVVSSNDGAIYQYPAAIKD